MAAPTLPTELIKHILELLYKDIRSLDTMEDYTNDTWQGDRIPIVFYPLLTASRTFHALALPILYRHLYPADRSHDEAEGAPCHPPVDVLARCHLNRWTKTLNLTTRLSAIESQQLLRQCTSLTTLNFEAMGLSLSASLLFPSTLVSLALSMDQILDEGTLVHLSTSLPELKELRLAVEWPELLAPLSPCVWTLDKLVCHRVAGSAAPIVQWLSQGRDSIKELFLRDLTLYDGDVTWTEEDFLTTLDHPLPALAILHIYFPEPEAIDANILPRLNRFTILVDAECVEALLTTSRTVRVAEIRLVGVDTGQISRVADTLVAFIDGHPALQRRD